MNTELVEALHDALDVASPVGERMPDRRWRVTGRGRGRCSASAQTIVRVTSTSVDSSGTLVALMSELYAIGWRSAGQARQWVWSVFPSLGPAVRVARGYAAFDGGGRWRVYGTRVVGVGDGAVVAVLGRRLAEGLEPQRQD